MEVLRKRKTTVSFHLGGQIRREHNLRVPSVTKHERHIIPGGKHETIRDESLADAFQCGFR